MKSSITEGGIFIGDYVTALFRWFVLFLIATAIWFPIRIYLEIP